MLGKNLIQAAAGNAGAGGLGIEDVFSTWLYTGNGSTQTITNGVDLAGEGGLVWLKRRDFTSDHWLFDTGRGATKFLVTNATNAEDTGATTLTSFDSDGFTLGSGSLTNQSNTTYASWTFRKAPGFFDVVTYTGDGVAGRTVPHNLGSVPGAIIVKRLDTTSDWQVYHRANTVEPEKQNLILNDSAPTNGTGLRWNDTQPTASVFTVGNHISVNASGGTYVAYLFAHDEQIFGGSGDQSVIKCGSYTGTGSDPTIDLGWEPQWLLIKPSSATGSWMLYDTMRGIVNGGDECRLYPNLSNAEECSDNALSLTPTGFQALSGAVDTSGVTYIYIAIRRGPMKTPTSATEVFAVNSTTAINTNITTNFPVDWGIVRSKTSASDGYNGSRLTGSGAYLLLNSTGAESAYAGGWAFDSNSVFKQNQIGTNPVTWMFRRAPGFFDTVAYTGTGVARTVSHNLGVAPELIVHKRRDGTGDWRTDFVAGNSKGTLNTTNAFTSGLYFDGTISATVIGTTLTGSGTNASGALYIAYLFATLPGISKCFSYTGTGTTLQVDCGFTSGARLVLIKRTDSTGDWYIWDTARGITSSTDPYLLLNSTAAEVTGTDYIDPYSAGFEISSTAPAAINASGGSFIGLAIA